MYHSSNLSTTLLFMLHQQLNILVPAVTCTCVTAVMIHTLSFFESTLYTLLHESLSLSPSLLPFCLLCNKSPKMDKTVLICTAFLFSSLSILQAICRSRSNRGDISCIVLHFHNFPCIVRLSVLPSFFKRTVEEKIYIILLPHHTLCCYTLK